MKTFLRSLEIQILVQFITYSLKLIIICDTIQCVSYILSLLFILFYVIFETHITLLLLFVYLKYISYYNKYSHFFGNLTRLTSY
jgi:hypothetical protein